MVYRKFYTVVFIFAFINIVGFYILYLAISKYEYTEPPLKEIKIINKSEFQKPLSGKAGIYLQLSGDFTSEKDLEKVMRIKPNIKGTWRFVKSDMICFDPESAWPAGFKGIVELQRSSKTSQELIVQDSVLMHTEPFKVLSVYQKNYSNELQYSITILCSHPISPGELAKTIILQNKSGKNLNYKLLSQNISSSIDLEIYEKLGDEEIKIYFNKNLPSINSAIFENDQEFRIHLSTNIIIYKVEMTSENFKNLICVQLNKLFSNEKLKLNIRITPSIDFSVVNRRGLYFLEGDFKIGEKYEVEIDQAFSDFASPKKRYFICNVPNPNPEISFNDHAFIYSAKGKRQLDLNGINISEFETSLFEIPPSNCNHFILRPNRRMSYLEEYISSSKTRLDYPLNQRFQTRVNLDSLLKNKSTGVFKIVCKPKTDKNMYSYQKYYYDRDISKTIIITDLGVNYLKKNQNLLVWVNKLSTAQGVSNASVKLLSKANSVLFDSKTDENGVLFERLDENTLEKMVFMQVQKDNDQTYLNLKEASVEIQDNYFKNKTDYVAYLLPERAIYRPGEKIKVNGVLRDQFANEVSKFPIIINLKSISGEVVKQQTLKCDDFGSFNIQIQIPEAVLSGEYIISCELPNQITFSSILINIASFVPQLLTGEIQLSNIDYENNKLNYKVHCRYLTNISGEGLNAKSHIVFQQIQDYRFPNLPNFKLGYTQKENIQRYLHTEDVKINRDNHAPIVFQYRPDDEYSFYKVIIESNIIDSAYHELKLQRTDIILPKNKILGIQQRANIKNEFDIGLFNSGGEVIEHSSAMIWQIFESKSRWEIKNNNGYNQYELKVDLKPVSSGNFDLISGKGFVKVEDDIKDNYVLVVSNNDGMQANFFISAQNINSENPFSINFRSIPTGSPGDNIRIEAQLPFCGKLLIAKCIGKEVCYQIEDAKEKTVHLNIKIPENAMGSMWLHCILIQSQTDLEPGGFLKTTGVIEVPVMHLQKKILAEMRFSNKNKSGQSISVNGVLKCHNGRPIINGAVVVRAVDVGIKQIETQGFASIFDFFYGPKKNKLAYLDYYDRIYNEKIQISEALQPGGDDSSLIEVLNERAMSFQNRFLNTSWMSEVITTNHNGEFTAELPAFDFQGTLQLDVTAFQGNNFGYQQYQVEIKNDIILQEAFPKFLYQGDSCSVPINLINQSNGPITGKCTITCTFSEQNKQNKKIDFSIEAGATFKDDFMLKVDENSSQVCVEILIQTSNDEIKKSFVIPVGLKYKFITVVQQGIIADEQPIDISSDFKEFKKIGLSGTLEISPSPILQLKEAVDYLVTYPYGCGEQTTSKMLPMVFSNALVTLSDNRHNENEIKNNIEQGLLRLRRFQAYSGGIALWESAREPDIFVSAYVAFLIYHLEKNNFEVNAEFKNTLLKFLQNSGIADNISVDTKSFILYVLCLYKINVKESLVYLNNKTNSFTQTGMCFLLMSNLLSGISVDDYHNFKKNYMSNLNDSYVDYGSEEKNLAVELLLAQDFNIGLRKEFLVSKLLSKKNKYGHWGSSQANAWSFFSLLKYFQGLKNFDQTNWVCEVKNGDVPMIFDSKHSKKVSLENLKNITLKKNGAGILSYSLITKGFSDKKNFQQVSNGISFSKQILSPDGNTMIANNSLKLGETYKVSLKVKCDIDISNTVIQEFLPSCFEFSDLVEQYATTRNVAITYSGSHLLSYDVKDDRIYFFPMMLDANKEYTFQYTVRCVRKGSFFMPNSKIEAMYDPLLFAETQTSNVIAQ